MSPGPSFDPYALLQVVPTADQEVVTAAFKALAFKYHPDRDTTRRAAEKMAGLPVRSVVTGIAGEHVRSFNSTGVIGVARRDREITRDDVQRVLEAARAVAIPGDRELLHVLPQGFTVDTHPGIEDPVGMTAVRLEAEVHIVTVQATAARNLLRAIDRAGLQVESVILQPLAAAQAAVAEDERGLGVALIDFGGGTTDVAVFHKGAVRHTATIGYGGRAVSHDLAVGLRTPVEQAERLKLMHGYAIAARVDPMRTIEVPGVGGRDARPESQRELSRIIEPRVTEILTLALEEIERVIDRSLLALGRARRAGSRFRSATLRGGRPAPSRRAGRAIRARGPRDPRPRGAAAARLVEDELCAHPGCRVRMATERSFHGFCSREKGCSPARGR